MSHDETCRFESSEAATKHAIHASGKNLKDVAAALWPDKTPNAAHTLLANALNDNRVERLTADQHIFVANHVQQYHWLAYAACRTGHDTPRKLAPEVQLAEMQQQIKAQMRGMRGLLSSLEAMGISDA